MKYYNDEIELRERDDGYEKHALEVLTGVQKSIEQSLKILKESP